MKKKIALLLLSAMATFSVTACNSGVSQEEYDKVVAERDELKAQLEALDESNATSSSAQESSEEMSDSEEQEFKIGETWEVDNLFSVTVNSVVESDYRNQFDESNPGAVYIITYTYENIGMDEELYISMEDKIVDSAGKMGTSYPGDYDLTPQYVPVGAYCEAQACIAVENPGTFKDYVSLYDSQGNLHSAIFNLDIQQ